MTTLLIHQAFVSPEQAGGTRHFEFAKHAINSGNRFKIIASDSSYLTGKRTVANRKLMTRQEYEGVEVLRAYTFSSLHRSFTWRVVSFCSFMVTSVIAGLRAGPADVVMGTSPPIFQAVSAWLIAFMRRKPLLLEIRDLWPEFAIGMGILKNPFLIRLSRWLERFLYARATHIIVNSPAYRDYLTAHSVPEAKITLIPNGVDPLMFGGEDAIRAREELGVSGRFVVCYAGALGLANDIPTILRTAERVKSQPEILFLLVGDGKERQALEKQAIEMGLSNVRFLGARPKTEMPRILAAADVCVATLQDIPMFRTTYPNKVFDYMAAGRPTILGIDGVIRKVIGDAGAGIYSGPGNDRRLAEGVLELLRNPELRRKMGISAREHVARHFDRQRQAAEFLELCGRLAAGKNPSSSLKPGTTVAVQ